MAFGYAKRHGFRPAWYILRTGAEHPYWEKLDADYFIAPCEKRGFSKKKAGKTRGCCRKTATIILFGRWSGHATALKFGSTVMSHSSSSHSGI